MAGQTENGSMPPTRGLVAKAVRNGRIRCRERIRDLPAWAKWAGGGTVAILIIVLLQDSRAFAAILAFLAVVILLWLRRRSFLVGVAAPLIVLGLWLKLVGSYQVSRDLTLALAALIICVGMFPDSRRRLLAAIGKWLLCRSATTLTPPRTRAVLIFATTFFTGAWVLMSLGDWCCRPGASRLNAQGFAQRTQKSRWPHVRVGVALSGGGYRAGLYHAGVLSALDHFGVRITNLSSVSGGSIMGSYYAAGGSPDEFKKTVIQGHVNLKRDLTDFQNAIRLPLPLRIPGTKAQLLPWDFTRLDVEANLLDQVFLGGRKLSDLPLDGGPRLLICATDLNHAEAMGFCSDGLIAHRLQLDTRPNHLLPDSEKEEDPDAVYWRPAGTFPANERLSKFVAVSGAFPLAFNAGSMPSIRKTFKTFASKLPPNVTWNSFFGSGDSADYIDDHGRMIRPRLLADGGVADNRGLVLLLDADKLARGNVEPKPPDSWKLDLVLSSDAGAYTYRHVNVAAGLDEFNRAIDIIYGSGGARTSRRPDGTSPRYVSLTPRILVEESVRKGDESPTVETKENFFLSDVLKKLSLDSEAQAFKDHVIGGLKVSNDPKLSGAGVVEVAAQEDAWMRNNYPWLSDGIAVFLKTSTLKDHASEGEAEALFRLGQYMVLLQWGEIKESLDAAEAANVMASKSQ
jgi:hypothetical protein